MSQVIKEIIESIKSGAQPGPFVPKTDSWTAARKFAEHGGSMHRDLTRELHGHFVKFYGPNAKIENAEGLHSKVEAYVKDAHADLGLDAHSKKLLIQALDTMRSPDMATAHSTLEKLAKIAIDDDSVHPLTLLALSVGVDSTSGHASAGQGHKEIATGTGKGSPIVANPLAVWHWDLAITIVAGIAIGVTEGAAAGVAGGLVNGAVASLAAAIFGGR